MSIVSRINRTSVVFFVVLCVSLVSPAAVAVPDTGNEPGNSAAAHAKKDDPAPTPDGGSNGTSSAPDESTSVALESSSTSASNGTDNSGGSNGNGSAGSPQAGGNGKKSADATITTTVPAGVGNGNGAGNGNGNGGGNGNGNGGGDGNSTFDPDPAPVGTPPSTNGPGTCGGSNGLQQGGPYDHDNCDGTQGQNGKGGNGKCAGCTGKADDKGPKGQHPGDHNNGYECDHNKGVGKGNPAHSKCKPPPPNCQTNCNPGCQTNCNPGCQTNCNPGCQTNCNPGCQVDCTPGCQVACNPVCQRNCNPGCQGPDCEPDEVLGEIIHRAVPATVQGARVRNSALPFTGAGSSLIPLLSLGLVLVTTGSLTMLSTSRRRKATRQS